MENDIMSFNYWKKVVINNNYNEENIAEHYLNLLKNNINSDALSNLITSGKLKEYLNKMDYKLYEKCCNYLKI